MNIYLVDWENVHKNGLRGIYEAVARGDEVAIFYSGNPGEISSLEKLKERHPECRISLYRHEKVHANYEDFQLCTYLGSVIEKGNDRDSEDNAYIISKDRGFDAAVDFWKAKGARVKRQETICGKLLPETERMFEKKGKKVTEAKKAMKKQIDRTASGSRHFDEHFRKKVRTAVKQDILTSNDYNVIYKAAESSDGASDYYNILMASISDNKGAFVYKHTKKIFKQYLTNTHGQARGVV